MILGTAIRTSILVILLLVLYLYINLAEKSEKDILVGKNSVPSPMDSNSSSGDQNAGKGYSAPKRPKDGVSVLIGKDIKLLEKKMGKPDRIDSSAYGYEWYIYNQEPSIYLQAGIENGKVVTLYVIGKDLDTMPFKIGQPIEEIFSKLFIDANINIEFGGSSYKFELNDTDINMRPLIKLGDIYAQAYVDKFTGRLSSVRFMDARTLVKLKPYEMVYRGVLIQPPSLSQSMWAAIEDGTERQIFDITNILRIRYGESPLEWDDLTADVAFGHSKDMEENADFSHTSKKYGDLNDRLEASQVVYLKAGENIAANYIDGPDVLEGWLNSRGHRQSLLSSEFTHLGVGVYRNHFTQNFIQKEEP